MPQYVITRARSQDLEHLPHIELAAARLLTGHAPESVLGETTSQDELQEALREGHLWVALTDDAPVGFAQIVPTDADTVHLEEIDVLPAHGRRGVGTRLVEEVCRWAAASGYASVSLTTFRDVPWNMPFYERRGFRVIPSADLSPALRAVVDDETRRGLDPSRRVAMKRLCTPTIVVSDTATVEDVQFLEEEINEVQLREDEARHRGCRKIVLSTHSFQAPDFYRKHGFVVAGEISNYPHGHRSMFLEKPL